jgi:hypothetical protein
MLRAPGQKDSVLVEDWRALRLDCQVGCSVVALGFFPGAFNLENRTNIDLSLGTTRSTLFKMRCRASRIRRLRCRLSRSRSRASNKKRSTAHKPNANNSNSKRSTPNNRFSSRRRTRTKSSFGISTIFGIRVIK